MIEWVPSDKAEVVRLAEPAVKVCDPRLVVPSKNVTLPVGEPDPVTVAVRVSAWPNTGELGDFITVVVVGALLTVSVVVPVWLK